MLLPFHHSSSHIPLNPQLPLPLSSASLTSFILSYFNFTYIEMIITITMMWGESIRWRLSPSSVTELLNIIQFLIHHIKNIPSLRAPSNYLFHFENIFQFRSNTSFNVDQEKLSLFYTSSSSTSI